MFEGSPVVPPSLPNADTERCVRGPWATLECPLHLHSLLLLFNVLSHLLSHFTQFQKSREGTCHSLIQQIREVKQDTANKGLPWSERIRSRPGSRSEVSLLGRSPDPGVLHLQNSVTRPTSSPESHWVWPAGEVWRQPLPWECPSEPGPVLSRRGGCT